MLIELLATLAVARALVVGLFGGVGLVLLAVYSRRGPLVFPVYAAILAALAAVLSRDAALPYAARYAAALVGFVAASAPFFVATMHLAGRDRARLRAAGRLPAAARGPSPLGYAAAASFLLAIGAVVSAGVAFVAG
jgi:hypothetical protein